LISDGKGAVTCVSEGLWKECGLHPKFFDYTLNSQPPLTVDDVFFGKLSLKDFRQAVQYPQGLEYKINSSAVFNQVNLEQLSHEE